MEGFRRKVSSPEGEQGLHCGQQSHQQGGWAWGKVCRSWARVSQFKLSKQVDFSLLSTVRWVPKVKEACLVDAGGCASGIAFLLACRLNTLLTMTEINKNKSVRDADLRNCF